MRDRVNQQIPRIVQFILIFKITSIISYKMSPDRLQAFFYSSNGRNLSYKNTHTWQFLFTHAYRWLIRTLIANDVNVNLCPHGISIMG